MWRGEQRVLRRPRPVPTHMGYADATVDGEGCRQVLVELAEPWSVNLVHQLGHADDLWGPGEGLRPAGGCVPRRLRPQGVLKGPPGQDNPCGLSAPGR